MEVEYLKNNAKPLSCATIAVDTPEMAVARVDRACIYPKLPHLLP
jgi:hypothetical protein